MDNEYDDNTDDENIIIEVKSSEINVVNESDYIKISNEFIKKKFGIIKIPNIDGHLQFNKYIIVDLLNQYIRYPLKYSRRILEDSYPPMFLYGESEFTRLKNAYCGFIFGLYKKEILPANKGLIKNHHYKDKYGFTSDIINELVDKRNLELHITDVYKTNSTTLILRSRHIKQLNRMIEKVIKKHFDVIYDFIKYNKIQSAETFVFSPAKIWKHIPINIIIKEYLYCLRKYAEKNYIVDDFTKIIPSLSVCRINNHVHISLELSNPKN